MLPREGTCVMSQLLSPGGGARGGEVYHGGGACNVTLFSLFIYLEKLHYGRHHLLSLLAASPPPVSLRLPVSGWRLGGWGWVGEGGVAVFADETSTTTAVNCLPHML